MPVVDERPKRTHASELHRALKLGCIISKHVTCHNLLWDCRKMTCHRLLQAIAIYHKNKIEFGPAKAANAGGVAVSGLEMAQNSARLSWSKEEVDEKLKGIMKSIFNASKSVSCRLYMWHPHHT